MIERKKKLTDRSRKKTLMYFSATWYPPYDEEANEATTKRAIDFMDMVPKSGYECVTAFSHAGFLRRMTDYVFQMSVPAKLMPRRNCAIAVFEHDGSEWVLHSWINIK